MGFKNVLGTIGKAAFPFITAAASAGGPLGTMAAAAVGKALGIDKVDPTSDGIAAAITKAQTTDADALFKIQQAEQEFQLQMTKLGFESAEAIAKIDADDRANARAREIALKDKIPAVLAIGITVGFFGCLALLAFAETQPMAHDILLTMTGSLGTAWIGIVNYYFGSSSGSAAKTALLANGNGK